MKLVPTRESVSTIRTADGEVMNGPKTKPLPKTIVKVQLPLVHSTEIPLALIYNKDRSVFCQVAVTEPLIARMGRKAKAYFNAMIDSRGNIEIDDRAPDQDW
jgi:hypothetical protein